MTTGATGPARADARRNVGAIVDAAAHMLASDPATPMQDIAEAAGVHRATLYRHFPAREDLIAALHRRALEDAEEAVRASRIEEDTAIDALERVIVALCAVGDRYRMLVHEAGKDPDLCEQEDRLGALLRSLVARGQAEGSLRADLDPEWTLLALGAVLRAGLERVSDGALEAADLPGLVLATVLDGIRARAREPLSPP